MTTKVVQLLDRLISRVENIFNPAFRGQEIHSVSSLLTAASTYLKTIVDVIDVFWSDLKQCQDIVRLIERLRRIENITYEQTRFRGKIDRYGFEMKMKKIRYNARRARERLEVLLRS